ncbi:MAG: hypothetical protein ACD_76C00088G0010 [uncultured bacterium]|nr:MAG: hypothetical protein ACD_76C00088G0010 [uncultured bacterium]HBD05334.1 NAD-dependent malic enzyme [Candidatus Uhrbacteria bacterium]
MDINEKSLELHAKHKGKIEITPKVKVSSVKDLSLVYTPGVAEPCRRIAKNPEEVWNLTIKANTVAIVTDGSAVLGLGNIGAKAAIPVMEGKAVLMKKFAGIDAFPICLDTQDPDEIVATVQRIAPVFGGINLEDISAPRCFEIEERLRGELEIPVVHDDQHGTSIAVLAGLINALKVAGKNLGDCRIAISGAGAAGIAIANTLIDAGAKRIQVLDSHGLITDDRAEGMNKYKLALAQRIKTECGTESYAGGSGLAAVLAGADVFIGVSRPGIVTEDMARSMAKNSIIFAMSNPMPEIMPEIAKSAGALVVATGRSDYPNQVNNALAFPGVFKGLLESRTRFLSSRMKIESAKAIADLIKNPTADKILPSVLDKQVADVVSKAVIMNI